MSEGEKEGLINIVHQKALAFIQGTCSAMKSLHRDPHPRMAGVVVGGGGNNPELRHSTNLELVALPPLYTIHFSLF